MTKATLDGPRFGPSNGGPPRHLVVLLHGYGANGDDLIALAPPLAEALPDTVFVAPDAPERLPFEVFGGRQWFALSDLSPREIAAGSAAATPPLEAFLSAELARWSLPPGALALVGFSQGTIMALHAGLRRTVAPAAIVGFSGALAAPDRLAGEIRARPPVLLVHGALDDVIPAAASGLAARVLEGLGVAVETRIRPSLGHGIDPEGLELARAFLARALGRAPEGPEQAE
ncbi:MAG: hypothetical protein GC150_16505 [Rhizobiales bacterium]|nr:hypothetical protein [Hyphomicrobiales bacterium]